MSSDISPFHFDFISVGLNVSDLGGFSMKAEKKRKDFFFFLYSAQHLEELCDPLKSRVCFCGAKKKKARSNPTESVVFLGLGLSEAAISEN